jgi:hypothetical protein
VMKWINESLALFTGVAVSGVLMDAGHVRNDWWGWVLGLIVFLGIATVVEHAGNGHMRLGLALEELESRIRRELESKINGLERSIEEMRRAEDKRL